MKVGLLGPASYTGRVEGAGWPVPAEACDRETAAESYRIQLEQFELAEELGFDWVSVSEHHFAPGLLTPNPIVLAAAASQRTERVQIAVLGPLVPLTNPVRVAEEIAMLDSITNGRVVVLPLRGTPNELKAYSFDGEPSAATREITQEGALLMRKAWQEPQPFSWRGEHFSFEHVSVWPRPVQEPHPPMYFSGNSFESIEFAAANQLGIAIGFAPPTEVAKHVEHFRSQAAAAGWSPQREDVIFRARALVAPDDEQANEIVERSRAGVEPRAPRLEGTRYGPSATAEAPQRLAGEGGGASWDPGFQFYGTPTTIVEQVRDYHDAGVGIIDIAFAGNAYGRDGTRKALNAFADILPALHAM